MTIKMSLSLWDYKKINNYFGGQIRRTNNQKYPTFPSGQEALSTLALNSEKDLIYSKQYGESEVN